MLALLSLAQHDLFNEFASKGHNANTILEYSDIIIHFTTDEHNINYIKQNPNTFTNIFNLPNLFPFQILRAPKILQLIFGTAIPIFNYDTNKLLAVFTEYHCEIIDLMLEGYVTQTQFEQFLSHGDFQEIKRALDIREDLVAAIKDPNITITFNQVLDNLNQVLNHLNQIQYQQAHRENINNNQSTHTTSVHKSVSESAQKLSELYGEQINTEEKLDEVLQKLQQWVEALLVKQEDVQTGKNKSVQPKNVTLSTKNQAAITLMVKFQTENYASNYIDETSEVSLKQLLALTYLAIHDDAKREGTLQNAQASYIEGLYEIQCGYNFDENDVYDGGSYKPICTGGTFNKLINMLQAVHPYCEIVFTNHTLAGQKLPVIVREEGIKYLTELTDDEQALTLIEQIEEAKTWEPLAGSYHGSS